MTITIVSSQEFKQDVSKAKRDALKGPVFIIDHGHPTHVLLIIEEYRKIAGKEANIVDLLAMPDAADIDFEAPKRDKELYRPADFL